MSDDTGPVRTSRRAVLGGLLAVGGAGAAAGAGTFALFEDVERADATVRAGTLDLTITDGGSIEWTIEGGEPGYDQDAQNVQLYNVGTVSADHVEIDFENVEREDDDGSLADGTSSGPESDAAPGSAAGMAKYVRVVALGYEDSDDNDVPLVRAGRPVSNPGRPDVVNTNDTPFIDLADLAADENRDALDDLPAPPANGSPSDVTTGTTVDITVAIDESLPNDYQGDVVTTTASFSLHQGGGQDA